MDCMDCKDMSTDNERICVGIDKVEEGYEDNSTGEQSSNGPYPLSAQLCVHVAIVTRQ